MTLTHRTAPASSLCCFDILRPFSNFDFVEKYFPDTPAVSRLFSIARSFKAQSMVIEDMDPIGIIADENEELLKKFPDYKMKGLKRITFWRTVCKGKGKLPAEEKNDFVGYGIIKRDCTCSQNVDKWHVFEAVMPKYDHIHNCVPSSQTYEVAAAGRLRSVKGVLYCQQNGLNKACAHVALRSLLSLHLPGTEIPYSKLNRLASQASSPFNPADGLNVQHIRSILDEFKIGYRDVDYDKKSLLERCKLPYEKFLYAGIESGAGAMLGFRFTGPMSQNEHHIIPFFGHTFNQDAWVSEADINYFKVGEKTRYTPSEAWCSSFIGHDDNFGPNFCVPRLYVHPNQAQYVVELLRPGVCYSGVVAEAAGVDYLYSILQEIKDLNNPWLLRLLKYTREQKVVLRAISLNKKQYMAHIRKESDWQFHKEIPELCNLLEPLVPKTIWLVEVSIPQLFPTNLRKLGESVLDATCAPTSKQDFGTFVFARFPNTTMLRTLVKGKPEFLTGSSGITSHVRLFQHKSL